MRRLLVFALAASAGCASGGGRILHGGDWVAVAVGDVPVDGAAPTLSFGEGSRATGNGGCNGFTALVRRGAQEALRFGAIAATKMACAPEVMAQEQRYFDILRLASGYSFYADGTLSVIAADGRAIRFRRR